MNKESKTLHIYEKVLQEKDKPSHKMSAIVDKTDVTLILDGRPIMSGDILWVEDMLVKVNKFLKECIKDMGK
jgi:hypothetical protein